MKVTIVFSRLFVRGILEGIQHWDKITFVDRWHAAQWVRGIRRNTRRGVLDYRLMSIHPSPTMRGR